LTGEKTQLHRGLPRGIHIFELYFSGPNIKSVDLEKYIIKTRNDFLEYSFYSKGPNGVIRKVAIFTPIEAMGYHYYNPGFGDWNGKEQGIDDNIVTNNNDTEKVLASVAAIITEFCSHYPESLIGIEASTESRMRLYQMKINKYWSEIQGDFKIFGQIESGEIINYEPGIKCLKFFGKRKLE